MPSGCCPCCEQSSGDDPDGHHQRPLRDQTGRTGGRSRCNHGRRVRGKRDRSGRWRRVGGGAIALAAELDKDPRFVEVVLSESKRVVRHRPGLLIVEHRLGLVMANAGIDHSNVPTDDGVDRVLLLPEDPDRSARALREHLVRVFGTGIAVIVSDSFGRAWRKGTVGIALGAAGLPALVDLRGHPDLFGRALLVTETGFADEIAAAASLLMGQADEAMPMVLVRGLAWSAPEVPAAALIRPAEHDLFR